MTTTLPLRSTYKLLYVVPMWPEDSSNKADSNLHWHLHLRRQGPRLESLCFHKRLLLPLSPMQVCDTVIIAASSSQYQQMKEESPALTRTVHFSVLTPLFPRPGSGLHFLHKGHYSDLTPFSSFPLQKIQMVKLEVLLGRKKVPQKHKANRTMEVLTHQQSWVPRILLSISDLFLLPKLLLAHSSYLTKLSPKAYLHTVEAIS